MKKMLVSLISSIMLFGCTSTKAFESQTEKINMKGNPTTGYTWTYEIENEDIIKIEEQIFYQGDERIAGAPSLFVYTISSLKPGTTEVKFEYSRSWETGSAIETLVYKISVDKKGKIEVLKNN